MKLYYITTGKPVNPRDRVRYAGVECTVTDIFDDGTVLLEFMYRGVARVEASAIGAAPALAVPSSGPKPVPVVPNFDRLNAATKRIDERMAKWDKTVTDLDTQIAWADSHSNVELGEALRVAKIYAQGQAATMLDITGMF